MAIEIIDQEVDPAGKLRVRVDIDGETVAFKFPKWPGRAVVMDHARELRRSMRIAERVETRVARLREAALADVDAAKEALQTEEVANDAANPE